MALSCPCPRTKSRRRTRSRRCRRLGQVGRHVRRQAERLGDEVRGHRGSRPAGAEPAGGTRPAWHVTTVGKEVGWVGSWGSGCCCPCPPSSPQTRPPPAHSASQPVRCCSSSSAAAPAAPPLRPQNGRSAPLGACVLVSVSVYVMQLTASEWCFESVLLAERSFFFIHVQHLLSSPFNIALRCVQSKSVM